MYETDWDDESGHTNPHNISFAKSGDSENMQSLQAPITGVFYINAYGQEVHPRANPTYVNALRERDTLVYSCGSLWTSIMPCLVLRGIGEAIASSPSLKVKVLLLNSCNDRETMGYTAVDYIQAIANMLNKSDGREAEDSDNPLRRPRPVSAFITHVVYLTNSALTVNRDSFKSLGVECIAVNSQQSRFDADTVRIALETIRSQTQGIYLNQAA